MTKVERSFNINAPIEKVFSYMINPSNMQEIWPSLMNVSDVQILTEGIGSSYKWEYKMGGLRFKGKSEIIEYTPNKLMTWKDIGNSKLEAVRRYTFETTGKGTKVSSEIEYTIPMPVLGKLAEIAVIKMNENEADAFFANLKARLEAE